MRMVQPRSAGRRDDDDLEQAQHGELHHQVVAVHAGPERHAGHEGVGADVVRPPPPELAYGHTASDDPDYVRGRHGSGEVVLVPWTVGRAYREFGKTDVRDHLGGVVRSLVDPAVSADVHDRVEVVAGESGGSTVVHLLNHSGARRRSYGAHVPVGGGSLRLAGRGADDVRADALVAGVSLPTRPDGADLVVELPEVGLFEVVRVAPAT